MHIAVCDDDEIELKTICELLRKYGEEHPETELSWRRFRSVEELTAAWEHREEFGLYLLDIIMPGKNGIEVGKDIRGRGSKAPIVYMTSSPDYALESYSVKAYQYLLKPLGRETLNEVLDGLFSELEAEKARCIAVKVSAGIRTLRLRTIRYVECEKHAIRYCLSNGSELRGATLREPFSKAVEGLLTDRRFLKTSSSFVINMTFVEMIGKDFFLMDGGARIPISRKLIPDCRKRYFDFLLDGGGTEL